MVLDFKIANSLMRAQRILFGPTRILRILKKYPIEEIHSHCFSLSLLGAKKFRRKRKVWISTALLWGTLCKRIRTNCGC